MAFEPTATKREYDEFFKGRVWADMKAKFEGDKRRLQDTDLETLEGIPLYRTQGTVMALKKGLQFEAYVKTAFAVQESMDKRKAETKPKENEHAT